MYKRIMGLVVAFTAMALVSVSSLAASDAGVILAASGATAKGTDGTTRTLDRRSPVNAGDTLTTNATGKLQVRMKDGAVLALGENSEFAIDSYTSKKSGDAKDSASLKLVKGSLMQVSGNMEKSAYSLETPVSTLGIRGTVFNIKVNADGTVSATVSTGAVASAAGQAVTDAQAKLSTAKVKANKAKKALEEAEQDGASAAVLAALRADLNAAQAELASAQTALDTATETAITEIRAGQAVGTNANGETVPVALTTFDSVSPAELARLVAENNPQDAAHIVEQLVAAFPQQATSIVSAATAAAPDQAAAISAAAEAGKETAAAEAATNDAGSDSNDSPITKEDSSVPDSSTVNLPGSPIP